jgi:two-component sensor histidine kinase
MRELLVQNLNPQVLVSRPVFFASLFWSMFAHFLDTSNNPPGFIVERAIVVVIAHLAMFGAFWLLVKSISKFSQLAQSLLMLLVIAIGSSVRGVVLWWLFFEFGYHSIDQFGYRAIVAIPILGIPVALFAITTHRVRGYSEARRASLAESERLLELKKHTQENIKESAEQRLQQIKQSVFASLGLDGQNASSKSLEALNETIEKVVRPLSHQLDEEQGTWVAESTDTSKIRINWIEVLKDSLLPQFTHPIAVGLSISLSGSVFILSQYSTFEAAYLMFVVGMVPWLVLWLLKSVLLDYSTTKPNWVIRLGVVCGYLLSGFLTGSATLVVTISTDNPLALFYNGQLFVLAFAIFFALASSAQAQARIISERLIETSNGLAWEVARVTEEQRQLRRALAHALHGPLQAGLTSALIRMKSASTLETKEFQEIESAIRSELKALVDSISLSEGNNVQNFSRILGSLAATWEGIATSEIELKGIAEDELSGDPVLMNTLRELLSELTFNAIKHGGANKVLFSVSPATDNTIELTCTDNGERPSDSGRVGLGTKLLDECALQWTREPLNESKGTRTEVLLPFAP